MTISKLFRESPKLSHSQLLIIPFKAQSVNLLSSRRKSLMILTCMLFDMSKVQACWSSLVYSRLCVSNDKVFLYHFLRCSKKNFLNCFSPPPYVSFWNFILHHILKSLHHFSSFLLFKWQSKALKRRKLFSWISSYNLIF